MNIHQVIRGPLLIPRVDGHVEYFADGALAGDEHGRIAFVGAWIDWGARGGEDLPPARQSNGYILPPFLDAHIHIPQHPIRGRFMAGLDDVPAEGRLLWGLKHNVFPAEGRCRDSDYARKVVEAFRSDTLAKGVVGGAAYMTVHPAATRIALEVLPEIWHVGLVLMNQECPEYLHTDETTLDHDIRSLAADFGRRLIVTDRFAVAVDSRLRQRAAKLSGMLGLRMQTHLNEQIDEKRYVEERLYPEAESYTDVYRRDGLLAREPILAHCVRMGGEEFDLLAEYDASIAHCPVSNTMLGSGVMPLEEAMDRNIPMALCTDVGASPTTSMLTEMVQFLRVHARRSAAATPERALYLSTLSPAQILGIADEVGLLEVGKPLSFIEVAGEVNDGGVDAAILDGLLAARSEVAAYLGDEARVAAISALQRNGLQGGPMLEQLSNDVTATARRLNDSVRRVTLYGKIVWESPSQRIHGRHP